MATAAATQPRSTSLRESNLLTSPSNVDRTAGIIKNVRVLGFRSANGREYAREAISKARGLYEGAKVHCDHDRTGSERRVGDFIGRLVNVQLRENGLYADLQIMKSHPLSELILERAERMPETFGLSHYAEGRVERQGGKMVVVAVTAVRSVDIVTDAATTNGLFESDDKSPDQLEIEQLLREVENAAIRKVHDDSASGRAGSARRAKAVSKVIATAIRDITRAMSAEGEKEDKVSSVPAAKISAVESRSTVRERADDAFQIPQDTKAFAQWLGGSGHARTRTPLSESQRKQQRFLQSIR